MGACLRKLCGEEGEDGPGVPILNKVRRETFKFTTPSESHLTISKASKVTLRVVAIEDKKRSIEIGWYSEEEYRKFKDNFDSVLKSREVPKNDLSCSKWKTAEDFEKVSDRVEAGAYHIVVRSSSIISDKNVAISMMCVIEELRK
jgi:hypothetical protein